MQAKQSQTSEYENSDNPIFEALKYVSGLIMLERSAWDMIYGDSLKIVVSQTARISKGGL